MLALHTQIQQISYHYERGAPKQNSRCNLSDAKLNRQNKNVDSTTRILLRSQRGSLNGLCHVSFLRDLLRVFAIQVTNGTGCDLTGRALDAALQAKVNVQSTVWKIKTLKLLVAATRQAAEHAAQLRLQSQT